MDDDILQRYMLYMYSGKENSIKWTERREKQQYQEVLVMIYVLLYYTHLTRSLIHLLTHLLIYHNALSFTTIVLCEVFFV